MAGGDVKLSKICRAYRPTITMKKAGDRLCMHLDDERIEKTLHSFIARKAARRVKPDTLIIVDPSDIQKPYATQMDFLSKVWDNSKGAGGKRGQSPGSRQKCDIICGVGAMFIAYHRMR